MIITVITFLLVLSLLVFVHELGHYLGARAVGVKVLEFSIGFPPKVFGKKVGETEYMLGAIPIGGYVRLLGQDPSDEDPEQPGNYAGKSKIQRFVILVAGPLMNLLFCWLIFSFMFMTGVERYAYLGTPAKVASAESGTAAASSGLLHGDVIIAVDGLPTKNWMEVESRLAENSSIVQLQVMRKGQRLNIEIDHGFSGKKGFGLAPWVSPVLGQLAPGFPADLAGLETRDLIVTIGGQKITQWNDITSTLQKTKDSDVEIVVSREGQLVSVRLNPVLSQSGTNYIIGVNQPTDRQSFGFSESASKGYNQAVSLSHKTLDLVGKLFTGRASIDSLGGPIMIAQTVGKAAKNSSSELLAWMGFISLQLGIFNLLPIPALDGGHIMFLILEAILGKPLKQAVREKIQLIGFSTLLLLIIYISIQDIIRL